MVTQFGPPCKNARLDGSRLISETLCLAPAKSYGVLQCLCETFSEGLCHVRGDRPDSPAIVVVTELALPLPLPWD